MTQRAGGVRLRDAGRSAHRGDPGDFYPDGLPCLPHLILQPLGCVKDLGQVLGLITLRRSPQLGSR
jgi:hypothetical protein